MTDRLNPAFSPDCTRWETIIGWIYLAIHIFALPSLMNWAQLTWLPGLTPVLANIIYYGAGLLVAMTIFWKLLRREFDHLLDRFWRCLTEFCWAYLIWYSLSGLMVAIFQLLGIEIPSPNDEAVDLLMDQSYNITLVISVIAAPIMEEVLFRGIAFQSLRKKSRLLAYVGSMTLFAVYHVWQFAVLYADPVYLLYAVQYLPITFALTWCYERSGSLWTPIFFHAANNLLAIRLQQML